MIAWAKATGDPDRVVDPGAGSGRFIAAAASAFPRARLVAVELDPLAALLTRATLSVRGLSTRSWVVRDDYRDISLPPISGQTLFVGNPPYVRHHKLSQGSKSWLVREAAARGLSASRLAGLHVHFFLATIRHAAPGDQGAFVTAAEWMDVNYGQLIRELVLDGLGGQAIHVLDPESRPFDDAQTTAAITCFEIGSKPSAVRLRRVESVEALGALSGGQAVKRDRLEAARRWSPLLRSARRVPPGHIELGELFRVHRGSVTGANGVWVVDPDEAALPPGVVYCAVTRARELFEAGLALTASDHLRGVVDLPSDLDVFDREERRAIDRFLRHARRAGAHQRYVARHRKAWWSVGLREPAPILATYMARRPPAFVRNLAQARHINIAHGLYPRGPLTEQALTEVAAALRSSTRVRDGRTYAGGLTKFEPREMERLLVPDVTAMG
ncbi:MAG: methyltransferase [Actinomycetota bacterium]|nr:methyltransferase [Actinomycetota bacterium]